MFQIYMHVQSSHAIVYILPYSHYNFMILNMYSGIISGCDGLRILKSFVNFLFPFRGSISSLNLQEYYVCRKSVFFIMMVLNWDFGTKTNKQKTCLPTNYCNIKYFVFILPL